MSTVAKWILYIIGFCIICVGLFYFSAIISTRIILIALGALIILLPKFITGKRIKA